MRAPRRRRQAGFTLTELMVVVALIAVIAGVAFARMGRKGDAEQWANTVARTLQSARLRAMSTHMSCRADIGPTSLQLTFTDINGVATTEPALQAPSGALVWNVTAARTPVPTAPLSFAPTDRQITYNRDTTIAVKLDSTNALNAFIFVAPRAGEMGWRYVVKVTDATGRVTVDNPW